MFQIYQFHTVLVGKHLMISVVTLEKTIMYGRHLSQK